MVEFLCFPMLHVCLKGFEVATTHLWHSMIRQLENMLINLDPIFPKKFSALERLETTNSCFVFG